MSSNKTLVTAFSGETRLTLVERDNKIYVVSHALGYGNELEEKTLVSFSKSGRYTEMSMEIIDESLKSKTEKTEQELK